MMMVTPLKDGFYQQKNRSGATLTFLIDIVLGGHGGDQDGGALLLQHYQVGRQPVLWQARQELKTLFAVLRQPVLR